MRANLGFVLARLGDLAQALEIETAALAQCVREGYHRFELASHVYLAVIHALRAEPDQAGAHIRAALDASASAPPIRAYALAIFADLQLTRGAHADAYTAATEAMSILEALEGVEEGEALIRLVHAQALEAMGRVSEAQLRIMEARLRLMERADRITDARLRRSFLDHIPENARTLAMAARLKRLPS